MQLDRVLSIVALNLSFELTQEKNKNAQIENVLCTRIQQLDHSLENALGGRLIVELNKKEPHVESAVLFLCVLIGCVIEFTNFQFFVVLFLHAIYCCLVKNKRSHNILADKNVHVY